MKKKLLFFSFYLLPFFLLLAGCSPSDTVYEGSVDFAGGKWLRFEPRELKVDIPDADECYELHISAVIDTALYHEAALPLTLKVTSGHGESRTLFADLLLHARDGHSLGQPNAGSRLVFTQRIREYFYFNSKGSHTVTIGQRTSRYEIDGIQRLTFTVRKAHIELPK